eukprot:m.181262 g.181262  ORF g.181262 m.181262 type:complete len:335 (+) comp32056_c0_seq8:340-1344(+)
MSTHLQWRQVVVKIFTATLQMQYQRVERYAEPQLLARFSGCTRKGHLLESVVQRFQFYPANAHANTHTCSCTCMLCERRPMMKPACTSCGGEFYSMDGPPTKSNSSGGFGNWSNPVLVEAGDVDHQLYSQITFPFYDIYLGLVMVYDATDGTVGPNAGHVHCRLSWSRDSITWAWVDEGGLTGREYIPAGEQGTFDSHVCFAAHKPIRTTTGADLYYMGGNGPHSGNRNSSFALARLPGVDRFGGVGQGSGTTRLIKVTGNVMTITMDVQSADAAVTISVASANIKSDALKTNMTDGVVKWTTAQALEPLVGTNVSFTIDIDSATVYTIGFYSL